ncbi:retrovirus-related pol polyprotein from transposon TNT 1-94 [Tanacetum coccineum]
MSQDVLLTVINSMSLNNDYVNTEMQKCESCEKCLNLDAELSKSKQAYNDFLKNYSQLEKHCISLEASMQLQQEVFQNDESCVNQNAVEIQEYFEINDLKARLQDKDKTICNLKDTIKSLRENTKEENVNHDKCDLEPINKEPENSVAKLFSENERKEIIENVVHTPSVTTIAPGMFKLDLVPLPPRLLQNRDAHIDYLRHTQEQANTLREIVKQAKAKQPIDSELYFAFKKVRFAEPLTSSSNIKQVESSNTSDSNTPVLSSTGVKCSTSNYGSKPLGSKRNARILQTPSRNKKNKVVQIVLWYLDSGCSKHMTGNRSQLMNFDNIFLGTVRFGNDQIARIMRWILCGLIRWRVLTGKNVYLSDILANNSRFTWVRFLMTKDEAPATIIKCIKNIQVRLNATVWNVQTDNGTEFVNQTLREFYENIGISHQTSVARTPQQNGVVERRNWTLVEVARTMLIFSKAPLFLWAEAINIACYTQNHSLICHRYNKTPYELMQDKKPDLSFFHVFGSLCYPTNDHEDLAMAFEQFSSGPRLHYMTPATSSTGLVSNLVSQQPFQEAAAPRAKVLADSPVSTSIDQDAPSTSIPSSQEQEHSPIISQGFKESPKTPTFHDDPLNESPNEDLTSHGSLM